MAEDWSSVSDTCVFQFVKECSVVVGVRIRPFNDREKALNAQVQLESELSLSASFAWTLMVPPPFCRILLRWRWNLARARRQRLIGRLLNIVHKA